MTEHVKLGSTIILGISGGPDSVFLFYQCLEISRKIPLKIIFAHINHNLRGKESQKDEYFVEQLAKKYHLHFECFQDTQTKKRKSGIEEAGRILRYKFFEKLRKKYKADWILTAHHRDDNIETVLFNLIRGTNVTGLKGIETVTFSRHLLRPMLRLGKAEIIHHLKMARIRYRVDETNKNLNFSRNWLRNKVIPLFKKINRGFKETFAANIEHFAETADFLETCCIEWLKKHTQKNGFLLDEFLKIHPALQKNILAHLYKKTHGSTRQLTGKNLVEILKVLKQKKAGRQKEFGSNRSIVVSKDKKLRRVVMVLKKALK